MTSNRILSLNCLCLVSLFSMTGCPVFNSKGKMVGFEGFLDTPIERVNRRSLKKLHIGMPKTEVLDIMGQETYRSKSATRRNPDANEVLFVDGNEYEVYYYLTDHFAYVDDPEKGQWVRQKPMFGKDDYNPRETDSPGRVWEWHRTPLVFFDGALIGKSRDFLRELSAEYSKRFETANPY